MPACRATPPFLRMGSRGCSAIPADFGGPSVFLFYMRDFSVESRRLKVPFLNNNYEILPVELGAPSAFFRRVKRFFETAVTADV